MIRQSFNYTVLFLSLSSSLSSLLLVQDRERMKMEMRTILRELYVDSQAKKEATQVNWSYQKTACVVFETLYTLGLLGQIISFSQINLLLYHQKTKWFSTNVAIVMTWLRIHISIRYLPFSIMTVCNVRFKLMEFFSFLLAQIFCRGNEFTEKDVGEEKWKERKERKTKPENHKKIV